MTHIQIHRSSVGGATPNTETMLEGEIAVNLTDKKLFVKGATGELITLAAPQTHADTDHVTSFNGETGVVTFNDYVTTFNGSTGTIDTTSLVLPVTGISGAAGITFSDGTFQPTAARSGFRYQMVSSGTGLGTPSSGHLDIDKTGEVDTLIINHTDKEGNDLKPLFQKLKNNGGYLEIMTGDFSQAVVLVIESQSGDDGIVSTGETTITVNVTTTTVQAAFDIEQGLDQQNITDVYLRIIPNAADFIREFNGITGSVDTTTLVLSVAGLSAGVSGITCANGITLSGNIDTTGLIRQRGNEATTHIDMSSAQDITINAGDDINLNPDGLSSFVFRNDGTNITVGRILGGQDGRFISVNDDMSIIDIGDLDTATSSSKIRVTDGGPSIFDGDGVVRETFNSNYRRNTDVATFTIDASSAIVTGAKTKSLYRVPYNGTLKNFDVKTSAVGGFTACVKIAGSDFATPTTGSVTGCSLGVAGLTGSSTAFNQATVTGGQFLYLDVFSNGSGSSAAQAFLTFESR